ncbi:MAG: ribose-phosphate diphosphokinase [Patescibacteria group bacterium]|nr:ribose-phosphate diphosphokinase [Patescibacteria group bacterium]
MVIFPFPQFKQYVQFLKSLPEYKLGSFQAARFPNQEIYTKLFTNVTHKDCLIIGSITPPDEQLMSFLFLAHTIKKELASSITALLPYLAYARQDKIKKGESLATSTIGEIFRASHINEVTTIDVHSPKVEILFPLPIHNLSPAKLFAKEIKKLKLKNPTFVSPDEGAIERTQKVIDELRIKTEIAYMSKERTQRGVTSTLHGQIGLEVIVIDDILDTGRTLLACCQILKHAGTKNIYIFVTHGLFTGNEWQNLFDLNVKKIYCTDSIPQVYGLKIQNLQILSIEPLLYEYAHHTRKIHEEAEKVMRGEQDYFLGEETG